MIPGEPELEVMPGNAFVNNLRPKIASVRGREVSELLRWPWTPANAVGGQSRRAGEIIHLAPAVHRLQIWGQRAHSVMRKVRRHAQDALIGKKLSNRELVGGGALDFIFNR